MTKLRRAAQIVKLSRIHHLTVTVKYDRPVTMEQARKAGNLALRGLRAVIPMSGEDMAEGHVERVTHSRKVGR